MARFVDGRSAGAADDTVVVEAPLEIRVGGTAITVIMRTPGADEELVRGFLFTEGLVAHASDIVALRRPEHLSDAEVGNVLDVELTTPLVQIGAPRSFYASASCGVCGKSSLAALEIKSPKVESTLRIRRSVLAGLPARLRAVQEVFEQTGGLHAAGLFRNDGELLAVREDVGRHNAVDKLAGWALSEDLLPLSQAVLMVSGRLGFEIVQKAIACAIPVIAAVSAPSSAALELCERFGITALGFVRGQSMNLYTHPERVVVEEA
jgi:FdhD protein